jgi:hypothetical protein
VAGTDWSVGERDLEGRRLARANPKDNKTKVKGDKASTSDDDIFGSVIMIP